MQCNYVYFSCQYDCSLGNFAVLDNAIAFRIIGQIHQPKRFKIVCNAIDSAIKTFSTYLATYCYKNLETKRKIPQP